MGLHPIEVSARFTEAAFWHSQEVAYRPTEPENGWIVLAGDAACGRPFYLGSTLNGHIHDVVCLAHGSPWSNWDSSVLVHSKHLPQVQLAQVPCHLCLQATSTA